MSQRPRVRFLAAGEAKMTKARFPDGETRVASAAEGANAQRVHSEAKTLRFSRKSIGGVADATKERNAGRSRRIEDGN